jgi:hypothetical protein
MTGDDGPRALGEPDDEEPAAQRLRDLGPSLERAAKLMSESQQLLYIADDAVRRSRKLIKRMRSGPLWRPDRQR